MTYSGVTQTGPRHGGDHRVAATVGPRLEGTIAANQATACKSCPNGHPDQEVQATLVYTRFTNTSAG